jgi:hypothetical protein
LRRGLPLGEGTAAHAAARMSVARIRRSTAAYLERARESMTALREPPNKIDCEGPPGLNRQRHFAERLPSPDAERDEDQLYGISVPA